MWTSHQLERRVVVIWAIGFILGIGGGLAAGGVAIAKTTKKTDKTDKAEPAATGKGPGGVTLNACGCYRTGESCMCTNKNARCDCPGDCEPVGCDEKRQKEMDREVAAEVKRAEDDDKKRQAAEAESERKAAEAQAARQKAEEGGDEDDSAAAGADKAAEPPADKAVEKPAQKAPEKPAVKPVHKGRAARKPAHAE
jgi:hypothetical protein